ncbi:putative plant lipid transfer protein/Par allergen [Helianthus anomalus]
MKGPMAIAMLTMIVMGLVMVYPSEAIGCNDLSGMLSTCIGYLTSGGSLTKRCCDGSKRVLAATRSRADKRTTCIFFKSAALRLKVRHDLVGSLPGKCGIVSPIPIRPDINYNL